MALSRHVLPGDATLQYAGPRKGRRRSPLINRKRASFEAALRRGRTILSGSDVGVVPAHGDNARELEPRGRVWHDDSGPTRSECDRPSRCSLTHQESRHRQGKLDRSDLIAVDGTRYRRIGALRAPLRMKGEPSRSLAPEVRAQLSPYFLDKFAGGYGRDRQKLRLPQRGGLSHRGDNDVSVKASGFDPSRWVLSMVRVGATAKWSFARIASHRAFM